MVNVVRASVVLATIVIAAGCGERPELVFGESCNINSDCESPLGCRLGSCRRICVESRDCGAGLRCLILPGEPSGACQLPEEAMCTLPSDCPTGFVCVFGTCTAPCVEDRDCALPGAICEEESPGVFACHEPIAELCIYNSDCPEPRICDYDQSCQFECTDSIDCESNRMCMGRRCWLRP